MAEDRSAARRRIIHALCNGACAPLCRATPALANDPLHFGIVVPHQGEMRRRGARRGQRRFGRKGTDAEGEANLRRGLAAWPRGTRRRIDARFRAVSQILSADAMRRVRMARLTLRGNRTAARDTIRPSFAAAPFGSYA